MTRQFERKSVDDAVLLATQLAAAQQPAPCSVCGGEPLPSGRECVCRGKGTEQGEMAGLRLECIELQERLAAAQQQLAAKDAEVARVREALRHLVNVDTDAENNIKKNAADGCPCCKDALTLAAALGEPAREGD